MKRRTFLVAPLAAAAFRNAQGTAPGLRVGLTPVAIVERGTFLARWQRYMSERLNRPVEFVVRESYQEITLLLLAGTLDVGWICGLPYVRNKHALQLVATPLYQGKPLYCSYLIVSANDRSTTGLADLKGRVFAYVSPDSNTGWLAVQVAMHKLGADPKQFFRQSFFAGSHRNVVEAVSAGLADGGMLDGYVWETLHRYSPQTTAMTRCVTRSEEYGFPPFVARTSLSANVVSSVREALSRMAHDGEGRALLEVLNLTGFGPGSPDLYKGIEDDARLILGS